MSVHEYSVWKVKAYKKETIRQTKQILLNCITFYMKYKIKIILLQ